jgi:hypothetical protein
MEDDDIDESKIGTPTPEQWAEMLKDPVFRAHIESLPKPPWFRKQKEEND